jgi:hypothetical protein
MVREWGAKFINHKHAKALNLASAAVLLIGSLLTAGSARAQAPNPCQSGSLDPGGGQDLMVVPTMAPDKRCHVGSGTYNYGNVNILAGGSLVFDELLPDVKIDFWAKSILVENMGSLSAGEIRPFGTRGGVLTIHLYGADHGVGGQGIICQSPLSAMGAPCGIPDSIWFNDLTKPVVLPGPVSDFFYKYSALPIDNGEVGDQTGFFGYKVLAVSYGGTLELFGKKGAIYGSLQPKQTGTSWVRLAGTILGNFSTPPGATSLTVASPVDWQSGDHVVVTTTDYLPNHSEELVICSVSGSTISFTANLTAAPGTCPAQGVQWTHNGDQFPLTNRASPLQPIPSRLNITKTAAETRAAVGLLTHSIRIVSEGDTYGDCFPPSVMDLSKGCLMNDPRTNYFFGGHTIARQGFMSFQVQGVEFRQLGQGGRLGHYPIHFHLARQTPPNTFVKDSSINESMTRWITVHGTQGVTLARNVGYLSIGHGFYLEDAVETDNQFYSNLGIFARAAVTNAQNPRNVPGILASPDDTSGSIIYGSDKATPAVFWIAHGWNDFQGNMAAGAGFCGVCYWEVPASISGPSRNEAWESYASEQTAGQRTGSSPLMNFDGNFCTSAMTAFQDVGFTIDCPGVGSGQPAVPVINPNAPRSTASGPPDCGPGTNAPLCAADYYPNVSNGQLAQATQCPAAGPCNDTTAPLCANGSETNCLPTVINDLTTSFNYSQFNFAAIWLRTRWHLVSNSFISDVQNGGLTFLSGGDYTHAEVIPGLWDLVLKTVFVGQTQPQPPDPKANPFASVLSPFSTGSGTGLPCVRTTNIDGCISVDNSFALTFSNFGVAEHMFHIYDGPASEDSNAYLDIKKTDLGKDSNKSVYGKNSLAGIPKVVQLDPNTPNIPVGDCYIPNAAIAWKQPNGFYYPPTFHSTNLFFDDVDIRHLVIVPHFSDDTYLTDSTQAMNRYCLQNQNPGMFNGFTAIDRQTELTDDDGSLTGYVKTISVNEDPFFAAPIDGPECQSDGATPEGGTARTSPYEYVTTVVYPDSATSTTPPSCGDPNWDAACSNETCFGVPLYRLYQTGMENMNKTPPPFIRMAATSTCQRETMTVNNGIYYVDLTASADTQGNWPMSYPLPNRGVSKNVFIGGRTYDFFLLFAKPTTQQAYEMFVGTGLTTTPAVTPIRVDISSAPFHISTDTTKSPLTPQPTYNSSTGILTVTLNLSAYADDFTTAAKALCAPQLFCQPTASGCGGKAGGLGNLTQAERNSTCSHAGEDVDCPTGGCVGFSVKLPMGFTAQDQTTMMGIPSTQATCFPNNTAWNVPPTPPAPNLGLAGACVGKNAPINMNFCAAAPLARFPAPQRR